MLTCGFHAFDDDDDVFFQHAAPELSKGLTHYPKLHLAYKGVDIAICPVRRRTMRIGFTEWFLILVNSKKRLRPELQCAAVHVLESINYKKAALMLCDYIAVNSCIGDNLKLSYSPLEEYATGAAIRSAIDHKQCAYATCSIRRCWLTITLSEWLLHVRVVCLSGAYSSRKGHLPRPQRLRRRRKICFVFRAWLAVHRQENDSKKTGLPSITEDSDEENVLYVGTVFP